jgi:GNAT superfamily N-acetyltransferase
MPALGCAIDDNNNAFYAFWHCSPAVRGCVRDGLSWFESGYRASFMNTIWRAEFAPEEADARIEAIKADFMSRQLPLTWSVDPNSRPADLGERLKARGLYAESDQCLAADLLALNEDLPYPDGLRIEEVADADSLRAWAETDASVFGMGQAYAEGVTAIEGAHGFDPALPRRMYLGWYQDRPVATVNVFLGGGVAGFYGVTVVEPFRRRGIGSAMMLRALRWARGKGYRVAVLGASEMGRSMYERVGFRAVPYRTHTYFWE